MSKRTSSIKSKLITLLLLSVGGSMLFAGIAISLFVTSSYQERVHNDFTEFYKQTRSYMREIDDKVSVTSSSISSQQKIISSVSFISEYMDSKNYQPLIFDGEKQGIAERLARFSRTSQVSHIRIYDINGWLISFADSEQRHYKQGYLSFDKGKPVIYLKSIGNNEAWIKSEGGYPDAAIKLRLTDSGNNLNYVQDENGIAIEVRHPINRILPDNTQKQVGTIIVTHYLDQEFISKLQKNPGYRHVIMVGKKYIVGDENIHISSIDFSKAPDLFSGKIDQSADVFSDSNYHTHAYSVALAEDKKFNIVSYMDKNIIRNDVEDTLKVIFLVFLLSSLAVLISGLWFARKAIVRPVEMLIETAKQIESGNYNPDVSCAKDNEFGLLCKTMSKMASTVKAREKDLYLAHGMLEERVIERTEELKKSNDLLSNEIRERELVEQNLILAKEEAEKSNNAKSEFLSRMSHELRTPLNAILGFSQLLEYDQNPKLTEEQLDNVHEIITAGNHLLSLIDEILDLARIESGKMKIMMEKINLPDSVYQSISLVTNSLEEKDIKINADLNEELFVSADSVRLKQVLLNLLSNAIKYNKPHGEISIGIHEDRQGYVSVDISDTGIGISEKNIEKLFTPFDRLDQDETNSRGTGIGLVISRELIQMMGGEMSVQSKDGEGSKFSFTLPVY